MGVIDPLPELLSPRWRVVLVRLPPGGSAALQPVLPRERPITEDELPLVLRVVPDPEMARDTAHRLRLVGAVVALLEENSLPEHSAYCPDHLTHLASLRCDRCRRPICATCVRDAQGGRYCPSCWAHVRQIRQKVRTRQLFVVFLFCAFLYEVVGWLRADRVLASPDGSVTAVLLQFTPPRQHHARIVHALNERDALGEPALQAIARWFNAEHQRYTGRDSTYLTLVPRGPWPVAVQPPPLAEPDDNLLTIAWRSWRYAAYFHDLAEQRGVDPDRYTTRLYVVYSDARGDLASHSRGSERGRVAISYVSLREQNTAYALVTLAHELAHTLGARDLYNPDTSEAQYPEGFVEPNADPLYPQRYAELMAVDIPLGPGVEAEIQSLDQVRIGYRTAADLGWIGEEEASWFYHPEEPRAQEALGAPEGSTEGSVEDPAEVPAAEQPDREGDPESPCPACPPPSASPAPTQAEAPASKPI